MFGRALLRLAALAEDEGGVVVGDLDGVDAVVLGLHPIIIPRFGSFRTQPWEMLSADSVRISLKCNPTPGTILGQRILGMRTGCITISIMIIVVTIIISVCISISITIIISSSSTSSSSSDIIIMYNSKVILHMRCNNPSTTNDIRSSHIDGVDAAVPGVIPYHASRDV